MDVFNAAPGVIIAVPQLLDPNFHRSVIMMVEHNEEGALGIVLNHETEHQCSDVTLSFELEWPAGRSLRLRRGGPVENQSLWMLHDDHWTFEETNLLSSGIAVSRSRTALTRMVEADESNLRLMVGYAGWGPSQLEHEIGAGMWICAPLKPEMIFQWPAEEVWERSLRGIGVNPAHLVGGIGTLQ
jgi:putative transcriptional regulator